MVPGTIALVSSCVLRMALGEAVLYDASMHTEARARTRAAIPGVLGEAEADPRLGLTLLDRRLDVTAAYFPRLMLQERVAGLQVLHRASMGGAWLADGNWRAIASAQGTYGTNDFLSQTQAALGGSPGATGTSAVPQVVQSIPVLTTLRYVSGELTLGAEGTPAARYRASARVTGFVEGGADRTAQASLPLQRGGRLSGELAWTASGADVLASNLALTISGFSTDQVDGTALATETWRHELTPDAGIWLGAGPSVTASRSLGATSWQFGAGGEAGVRDRIVQSLDTSVSLRVAPIVDRITAAAYERADGTLTIAWRPALHWTLGLTALGGVVLRGNQAGDKIASEDVRVGWSPTPAWEVALGVRGFSQMPQAATTVSLSEWNAYFAVTARDRDRL